MIWQPVVVSVLYVIISLASLATWLGVRLWIKWLWVRIPLQSFKLQIWCLLQARSSLIFRQTMECRFTLNLAGDKIVTYSQMHRTDTYSQRSSFIWPVWLNGRAFIYELSGCGFESRCSRLILQIRRLLRAKNSLTFRQTIDCRFTLNLVRDMITTYSQMHRANKYSQHSSSFGQFG